MPTGAEGQANACDDALAAASDLWRSSVNSRLKFEARLAALERRSAILQAEMGGRRRGRYEDHYLRGWPAGEAYGFKQCAEHSPTCAVRVTYISMAIVRQVIFDGGGPFLDLR